MCKNTKWLVPAAALALMLFFGPSTGSARAWDGGPRVAFSGRFGLPHGSVSVYANNGFYRPYYRNSYRRYSRPYPGRFYRPYYRPYRLARFYVYTPYPHWVSRRIYYPYSSGVAYCNPY